MNDWDTFYSLSVLVAVLQDVLSGSRQMELKPAEERPPHYRQFRVDPTLPLTEPPTPKVEVADWQQIQKQYEANLLGSMSERFGVEVHAYVLMGSRYHLILHPPKPGREKIRDLIRVFV